MFIKIEDDLYININNISYVNFDGELYYAVMNCVELVDDLTKECKIYLSKEQYEKIINYK